MECELLRSPMISYRSLLCNTTVLYDNNSLSLTIHQSKTDPFRQGHQINISATNASTCPVQAMQKYMSITPPANRKGPLYSDGRFLPSLASRLLQCYVNFCRVPIKKQK